MNDNQRVKPKAFRIAARGLIVQQKKLLFVSNDGEFWYLPGGQLEKDEDLTRCVEREVYEETGLVVKAGTLLHVLECVDVGSHLHKVHFYFRAEVIQGKLNPEWEDEGGGVVQYRRFFDLEEIKHNEALLPRFLGLGTWLSLEHPQEDTIYQGLIYMNGFEVLEGNQSERSLELSE